MGRKRNIFIDNMSGGLNTNDPVNSIKENESILSTNCYPGKRQIMFPRKPVDVPQYFNVSSFVDFPTLDVVSTDYYSELFESSGGVIYTRRGDKIFRDGTDLSTDATGNTAFPIFLGEFYNKVYYRSGNLTVLYKDTGSSASSSFTFTHEIIDVKSFKNRLFAVINDSTEKIFYSPIGSDSTFTDYISVPDSGVTALGLFSFGDNLYVCTTNGLYVITGRSALSFSIDKVKIKNIPYPVGGIRSWKNFLVYVSHKTKGIFLWDGYGTPIQIDKNMNDDSYRSSINALVNGGYGRHFEIYEDLLMFSDRSSTTAYDGMYVFDLSKVSGGVAPCSKWSISPSLISKKTMSIPTVSGYGLYGTKLLQLREQDGTYKDNFDYIDTDSEEKILPSVQTKYFMFNDSLIDKRVYKTSITSSGSGDIDTTINFKGNNSDTRTYTTELNNDYSTISVTDSTQTSASGIGRAVSFFLSYSDIDDYSISSGTRSEILSFEFEMDTEIN